MQKKQKCYGDLGRIPLNSILLCNCLIVTLLVNPLGVDPGNKILEEDSLFIILNNTLIINPGKN